MEQKEIIEQVSKLLSDNPAKFIKIRDTFDEFFGERKITGAQSISDREFDRIRYRFRDIDVPLSWCVSKESLYQLYKAVSSHRARTRRDESQTVKKSSKTKKKGLFGFFS